MHFKNRQIFCLKIDKNQNFFSILNLCLFYRVENENFKATTRPRVWSVDTRFLQYWKYNFLARRFWKFHLEILVRKPTFFFIVFCYVCVTFGVHSKSFRRSTNTIQIVHFWKTYLYDRLTITRDIRVTISFR